jgi:hypothetical protein
VANKTVPQELRFIAVIALKNAVSKNWKSKEYAFSLHLLEGNTAHSTQHTAHSTQHTAHSTQHTTRRLTLRLCSLLPKGDS